MSLSWGQRWRGAAGGPWLPGNPRRRAGGGGVTAHPKPVQPGSREAGADRHWEGGLGGVC